MKIIQVLTHCLVSYFQVDDPRFLDNAWHSRLARDIAKRAPEFQVECWTPERNLRSEKTFQRDGLSHRLFPSFPVLPGRVWAPAMVPALRREATKQPIVAYFHGIFSPITYGLARAFPGLPMIAQDHLDGFPLANLHEAWQRRQPKALVGYALYHLLEFLPQRLWLKNIGHFFSGSPTCVTYLSRLVGKEKVTFQPVGTDFSRFTPMDKRESRRRLGLKEDGRYVVFVGSLVRLKGVQYLLAALPTVLSRYPDATAILIGEGYYRRSLEQMAKQFRVDQQVLFVGYRAQEELPLWYNAADVFVLPSYHEAQGVAGVEALACGIPYIGSRVGGIPRVMEHFQAGIMVSPGDPQALAEAMIGVLTHPEAFRADPQRGRPYYDQEVIFAQTIAVARGLFADYYGRGVGRCG